MGNGTTQPTSRVRQLSISADEAGQRIDNFLSRHLKGVPRSHIYRILRRGEVRVNRGRIRPQYKLRAGDTVRIPPVRMQQAGAERMPGRGRLPAITGRILFENSRLLVLDKPAGIAVHGGSGLSYGVIEALRVLRPEAPCLELVHRLDRDTSGCLMIAKRRSALRNLHEQLREGRVSKHYLALVRGVLTGPQRVDAPLRKNHLQGGERIVRVQADGRPAATRFTPVSRHGDAMLLEVVLETGRTHQIRVHAAHIGHPLAGDEKYGDVQFNRSLREHGLRRMFLHAHMIEFADPATGEAVNVSAPLDDQLRGVLDSLDGDRAMHQV